jgi:hypothetical protein
MTINDLALWAFALQGYVLSDQLENSEDPNIVYYGYLNRSGQWYISERNITNGTFRFIAGPNDYQTNWGLRESREDYVYFNLAFPAGG